MTMIALQRPFTRFDGVQLLRFLASAMVLVAHATIYTDERLGKGVPIWRVGGAGVDIFFVISGFVIVLASRGRGKDAWVGWQSFLARRGLRIFPMYWLATLVNLAIFFILPGAVLHSKLEIGDILQWFLLVPTYNSDGRIEPLIGVAWTLYFETFFYALFALSLYLRRSPFAVVAPILLVCAATSLLRRPGWPPIAVYLDPKVLEFLIGMLIAASKDRLTNHPNGGALTAAIGVVLMLNFGAIGGLLEFVVRATASAMIVGGTVALESRLAGRVGKPLLFLGAASYAIYLIHPLVVPAVPMLLRKLGMVNATLSVVGCIAVGLVIPAIVYHWAEKPILAAGSAWLRARTGSDARRSISSEIADGAS